MIELDMAIGLLRSIAVVIGALGIVCAVTWACADTVARIRKGGGE